ncbi:MAG: hypothetical protein PHG85_00580 [Candidatus Altiarchaeota archaeon]|nr:hypothetical protein [Candidatus Altiarchaeota archaeon]
MGGNVVFEIPIHLNPSAFTHKTSTLVFTETGFYVKEAPELAADYINIISAEKKSWWVFNSLIRLKFNTPVGPRDFRFTAARGISADELGNKKVYSYMLGAIGKRAVKADAADASLKSYASSSKMGGLFNFRKIETREDALTMIKDVSKGFIVVAVILAAIGFFIDLYMLIDAFLFGFFGVVLFYTKSRLSAMALFLLSVFAFFTTVYNFMHPALGGGKNIFLAVILLWGGLRAVQAANRLHSLNITSSPSRPI